MFSITLKLTSWYALVLAVSLALFSAAIWFSAEHQLSEQVDERLRARIAGFQTVIAAESEDGITVADLRTELDEYSRRIPEGSLVRVYDDAGVSLAGVAPGKGHYREVETKFDAGGNSYRATAATSLADYDSMMAGLFRLFCLAIPVALIAASAGGYWLSRRALRPVDQITREVEAITLNNLERRLTVPSTGDELARLSRTWNQTLERLESSVKRVRQFTGDASHELRTPVALIRATAELALRRERSAGEYQVSLSQIRSEAERMTELTESLLTLARADDGGLGLELSPTDLVPIVRDTVRQCAAEAEKNSLVLRADLPPEAVALAHETSARRLLLALVDNALKYTPAGGAVAIAIEGTELSVTDTGIGIPEHEQQQVFERFFRADSVRGPGSGAGLGLCIAQALAHAQGVEIKLRSKPGEGSRFSVLFSKGTQCVNSRSQS